MRSDEHKIQKALIEWAGYARCQRPELDLLYAIPNGGHRDIRVAAKLKAEGVKRGVPDLCLPVMRGGFAALYIEMKTPRSGSKLSPDQEWWFGRLSEHGALCKVCRSVDEARQVIEGYLAA